MQNIYSKLYTLNQLDSIYHREMGIFFRFCMKHSFRVDFKSMERFVFLYMNQDNFDMDALLWISENNRRASDMVTSYDFYCGDKTILETSDISILLEKILKVLRQQLYTGLFTDSGILLY